MKQKTTILILLMLGIWLGFGVTGIAQERERKEKTKKEGKLGDFEDEVDGKKKKSDNDDDDDDHVHSWISIDDYLLLGRITYGLLVQFPGESRYFYNGSYKNSFFSDYPYAVDGEGHFSQNDGRKQSINITGNYFYSESDLDGLALRAQFSPNPLYGAEVHFADIREELNGYDDRLQLFGAFVNYNRFRLNRFGLRWGLGVMGLRGDNTRTGFAFNSGMEWYFKEPLSLELQYSGGFISERYVPEFYGALNLHYRRMAFSVGYQYWSAGNVVIDGVTTGVKLFL